MYGASEMGQELVCYRVGDQDAAQSILMTFGVHGFEDAYDHDGQVLKDIAEGIIAHYAAAPDKLTGWTLYIVPSANPDGLIHGESKNGFGRCNANGMDVNRDFPVKWAKNTAKRNRTGDEPFSTAEARAIRDLVERIKPTAGIDVHGWLHTTYGNEALAAPFRKALGCKLSKGRIGGAVYQWYDEVTEAGLLIELPAKPQRKNYVPSMTEKLIQGLDEWMAR